MPPSPRWDDIRRSTGDGSLLRRQFVGILAALGATGLFGGRAAASQEADGRSASDDGTDRTVIQRLNEEFRTRLGYSRTQLKQDADRSTHASNGRLFDEHVVTKFGKSLPHDEATGLPAADAYDTLVTACETRTGFEGIPQADIAEDEDISPSPLVDGRPQPRPLVQPESAWTYMTEGASTAELRIAPPPAFDSPEAGAEMVELYWRALTRDVNFRDYDDSAVVAAAVSELDGLARYNGPGADGRVTPGNVFRGVIPGATTGPYVSQFLWKDRPLGGGTEDQKIEPQAAETTPRDYMTTVEDWLKIQHGVVPPIDNDLPGNEYASQRRYIVTGRDMCERVHDDPPFRQVQKAAQVLIFGMNAPLDEGIPYTLKPFDEPSASRRDVDNFIAQTTLPFNDFGPLYIEKKVLEASEHGQKAAWHKKWNVHRRLRPEEYGGRVQAVKGSGLAVADTVDGSDSDSGDGNGNGDGNNRGNADSPSSTGSTPGRGNGSRGRNENGDGTDESGSGSDGYPIPTTLLESEALSRTKERYGTYLLPQAYAEGSPTHPSYPAGHSVVAGAGVTVLKALFDGDYEFSAEEKVVPTRDGQHLLTGRETDALGLDRRLTVRGELNKLASNMALGRNRAGIHYRSDGIEGLRLGEAAALRFLEDQLTLPDWAGNVTLTMQTFDGEVVRIEPTV